MEDNVFKTIKYYKYIKIYNLWKKLAYKMVVLVEPRKNLTVLKNICNFYSLKIKNIYKVAYLELIDIYIVWRFVEHKNTIRLIVHDWSSNRLDDYVYGLDY